MPKWWTTFEAVVEKSHLRVPIYILFFVVGITLFFNHNIYLVLLFVGILGLYAVFEGLNPSVWREGKDFMQSFVPRYISTTLVILVRVVMTVMGVYVLSLAIVGFCSYITSGIL